MMTAAAEFSEESKFGVPSRQLLDPEPLSENDFPFERLNKIHDILARCVPDPVEPPR